MDETTASKKRMEMITGDVSGKKAPAIIPYRLQGETGASSPGIGEEKVRNIRRQLAENKYDFRKRLDAAFDNLLKDLVR